MDRGEISPGTMKRLASLGICQSSVLLSGFRFLSLVLNVVDIFLIFTSGEGGKMRRSDGLQQLKFLFLVSFSGVIFPYSIPAQLMELDIFFPPGQ